MVEINELTDLILAEIVPQCEVDAEDIAALAEHREWLLGLEDDLVATFYDTLYAHGPTAAVFEEGERPAREQTLRDWWQRTVEGPIDEAYLRWMTLVGIVHIRRGVRNPMMVSIATVVVDFVNRRARAELDPAEADRIRVAWAHLGAVVVALVSESFTQSYIGALEHLAGLDPKLTSRMLAIEVKDMEAKARQSL